MSEPAASNPANSPRGRLVSLVVGLVFTVPGVLVLLWVGTTALNVQRLDSDGKQAKAQVTEFRTVDRRVNGKIGPIRHYELQYAFEVPGSDVRYVPEDDIAFIQQDEVWVELSEEDWNASRETRTIDIEYLESNPKVNRAIPGKRGWGHIVTFVVVGLALLGIGVLFLLAVVRRSRKPQADPAVGVTSSETAPEAVGETR